MTVGEAKTIECLLTGAIERLNACSDSPKLDAQILLSFVLEKPRTFLLTWPEKTPNNEQVNKFLALLDRRLTGEPIAYIVGEQEFWSLPIKVAPCTLIPRPDTEVLVETVLTHCDINKAKLLDLGTGTGAIALALASEQPNWQVSALDFNHEAVALAQENAKLLSLEHVTIFQSSWFDEVEKNVVAPCFDIIVSNPPYIDEQDEHLVQGDVRFEPKTALVANNHGLSDIEKIALNAKRYLAHEGKIFVEHGWKQKTAVQAIFRQQGYQLIETVKDYGGNDRITFATWLMPSE